MATPGTEAYDAVGGALKPKWREWPSRAIRRVLSERVAFDILPSMIDAKREDHFLQAAHRTNAAVEADEPGLGPSPGEYRLG